MNHYQIHWGIILTEKPVSEYRKTRYSVADVIRFTRIGANAIFFVSGSKERSIEIGIRSMSKYGFTGQFMTITDRQFNLAEYFPKDTPEDQIKPKINLSHTLSVFTESQRMVIPLTKKQVDDIVKIDSRGGVIVNNENSIFTKKL